MKRIFLALAIILFTVSAVRAQEPGVQFIENKPWKEIIAQSAESGKLIFLDCYATWCGPCKAMARDVFPLPEVGEFMNKHFINVKQDMEKGEGIELNKKYRDYIPAFPTYLLINEKGEVVHQVAGYNAAEIFLKKIKDGLEQRSWIPLTAKYDKGERSWEFIQTYLEVLEDGYQKDKIGQVTREMLPLLNLKVVSENAAAYKIFRKYWDDAEKPLLAEVLLSPGTYRGNSDKEKDINDWAGRLYKKTVDVYVNNSITAPEKYDRKNAEKLIEELRGLGVSYSENMITLMLISRVVVDKDEKQFVALCTNALEFGLLRNEKGILSDWSKLLAEKTTNRKLLNKYLSFAAVKDDGQLLSFNVMRNYAFILEKTGDKATSRKYYEMADKQESSFKERFKDYIKRNN